MPSMVSTIGGTKFGTPQKLTDTVGRLSGRLARGKGTQTKCVDSVAASFALSTKHRLLAVNPDDNDTRSLQALVLTFDSDGEKLLIGTAQGAIYKVDLLAFRFHLMAYVPDEITCLVALPTEPEPFVVAGQKNGHLFSVNQVTHERSADRPAHDGPVLGVCATTSSGTLCSYSKTEAFVWRGGQLKKMFQLRLNSSALIVKMIYLSDSALLGAFGDDSVYVWCLETLQVSHEVLQLSRHRAGLADVAAADDVFYAAGKSSQVFEFSLAEDRVTRIFSLPDGSGAVAHLSVFPGPFFGQILQVLLESGANKFIHTETGHVVQSLGHPRIRIASTSSSHTGLFLACLLATGHICLHHSTGEVFRRIVLPEAFYDNKPRVLLVDDSTTRVKTPAVAQRSGSGPTAGTRRTPKRGKTPLLNTARLGPIVREHGEFPAQYRRLVWRHLLELPGAHALYVTVAERGQHPAWRNAAQRYPVRDPAVAKVLSSTLSALAWWCPLFAEVEFLPYFVFPFCNVFSSDPLTALEMVITLLVNWCQRWFEFFPYPPISVLGLVENMLAHHCPELLKHYMKLGVTAHVYGWPLLETAFSEVFTQNDWLVAWDHILSNHPSFMLAVVVAYNVVSQAAITRCKSADDVTYYFRNQNVVSVRHVMRRAYSVHENTPDELHARHYMDKFEPIGPNAYPVFNKYPTFIVNHQLEERERISREHQTFLEERGAAVELAKELQDNRAKRRQYQCYHPVT
ncbi:TBC1 domain family member 31 [Amphibalanus amphitrite]|uniref:TBC1 domain family member 31 n=1 Tax=Amphibalanus amphitrite TaxID=1232801 RepID=A0A6A4W1G6_AMPAM|nr:TBC1 domain family member 31 [Amphibalanus amphitrite]